ncbi:MAG: trypsin-like peptidase domain-containing protein [Myxococcales bacterium]|nr:trypsin-like peptidase domain-containing protein [Myxococcales bacterium]MCB9750390.1 trypsin-like peptidase domain-containing protein [Myxococcales bacterium]
MRHVHQGNFRRGRLRSPRALIGYFTLISVGAAALAFGYPGASEARAETPLESLKSAPATTPDAGLQPTTYDPRQSLAPLVKQVGPAVISVRTSQAAPRGGLRMFPFGQGMDTPAPEGVGSGFVISADGLAVTNHHVIKNAERIEVKLSDGRVFKASVLGSDPYTDLALLKLEGARGLTPVPFGSSHDLQVGDWVLALGSPMGLEQSATMGIISAKGRGSLGLYQNSYIDFIQTDAAISPGNSGGPLFNLKGEVIGINTAIHAYGRGIGFAVPVDQAKNVVGQLRSSGKVVRGWLGISGRDVEPAVGSPAQLGAVVGQVHRGTPAATAGLEAEDRITAIDGVAIESFADLRGRIAERRPDETLAFTVIRDGRSKTLRVKLGELPDERTLAGLGRGGDGLGGGDGRGFGSGGQDLFDNGKPRLGVEVNSDGGRLEISRVAPDSLASRLNLQPGDVVESINGEPIRATEDVARALSRDRHHVEVTVRRGSATHTAVMDRR